MATSKVIPKKNQIWYEERPRLRKGQMIHRVVRVQKTSKLDHRSWMVNWVEIGVPKDEPPKYGRAGSVAFQRRFKPGWGPDE